MFSAAIFDMDGLLIDSERAIMGLWERATTELGRPLSQAEFIGVIGRAASESAAVLTATLGPAVFARASERVRNAIMSADPAKLFPLKPGSRELLIRLRDRGIRCAVASSTVSDEVRRRLSAVGLLDHFDSVVGGDLVARGKPDPALYRLAVDALGIESVACLAFEDSDNGVAAAAAAGVRVILVPDLKTPSDTSVARSLEVLPSLSEALSRLDSWFPTASR